MTIKWWINEFINVQQLQYTAGLDGDDDKENEYSTSLLTYLG